MKTEYFIRYRAIMKSGAMLDEHVDMPAHMDVDELIESLLKIRDFAEAAVRGVIDGGPMTDGIVNIDHWQINAMDVSAVCVELFKIKDGDCVRVDLV